MRILTRYVLNEVGHVFLLALVSLTTLIMLVGVTKEALQQGLGLQQMAQLIPYLLPSALLYSVPGTILFAVAIVYGRMAGTNEVVAIKSLGISPMAFLWPTILLSVVLSFITVWLNDVAMTWSYFGVQRVVIDAVEDIIYGILRSQHSYSNRALSITVKRVEGRILIRPTFTFQANGDTPAVTISSEEAELRSNPGSGVLTIICRNGTVDVGGATFDFPDTIEREIPLDEGGQKTTPAAHTALSAIPEQIIKQRQNVNRFEKLMGAEAGYELLTGDFGSVASGGWDQRVHALQEEKWQLHRLMTEQPRRWANGFSCLCFALVGACLAIQLRNSDPLAVFFRCFGLILLIYYPLLMYGVDRAKSGSVSPYMVWLGNVILLFWGLWLLRKVLRY
jgi:lipopolysaccharide export system permease protein